MRSLARNKKSIQYLLYQGETEAVDADGNYTGEKTVSYSEPVTIRAVVSASRGTSDVELFGVDVPYTNTVIVDDMNCPIDEHSRLIIDTKRYAVLLVAKSLNHISYAVKHIDEAEEPLISG